MTSIAFAVPTYLFVGSCAVMLLVGLGRLATGHLDPVPAGGTAPLPPATASLGVLLVLHAFAAGCTALTGVEAISNGVPAFRAPEARNARRTLVAMGMILGQPVHRGELPGRPGRGAALRERQPDPHRAAGPLGAGRLVTLVFRADYNIAVNGTGAVVTLLVLVDIIATKFSAGAWIVLLILPLLVLLLDRTNRAYARERERLEVEAPELLAPPKPRHGDRGRFRRLLHDQTGRDLFAALNRLAGVNVAIVHPSAARHPAAGAPARSTVP